MILKEYIKLQYLALHKIGNKTNDEGIRLSKDCIKVNSDINNLLLTYFLSPFKSQEYYNLYHESNINLNAVYSFVSQIFDSPTSFYDQSVGIAKHLYEQSIHPKVKPGELYVAFLKDCIVDGDTMDAIGLFKSESKETYLKVYPTSDNYNIENEDGININKLDKGCLIFNKERENGYMVAVIDNNGKGSDAQYWVDHFLHVRQRNDEYLQTSHALSLCKNFVAQRLPEEFEVSKADQVDILNKSVQFFKEKEKFELDDFTNEVLYEQQVRKSFIKYKSDYERERDFEFSDHFDISEAAVKKQSRVMKSVIKLDKNFHIYVHGKHEYIIKGYDEETGLNFYKLFFKDEN